MGYDLEEQLVPEQFVEEDTENTKLSYEAYKKLKEYKKRVKYYEKLNKQTLAKHKPTIHKINSTPYYICDKCKISFKKSQGSLIQNKEGSFFYCDKCSKELYPTYKKVFILDNLKKNDYGQYNF